MLLSLIARCFSTIDRCFLIGLITVMPLTLSKGQEKRVTGDSARLEAQVRYPLRRGVSSFVIQLEKLKSLRCLSFVNENAQAEGRMSIALSDQALAADSPSWKPVAGSVRFRHKRRFALSLVGVEANYVRLTFEVDRGPKVAGLN